MSHQPPPSFPTDTSPQDIPLPETPAAEIPLPDTPAREIPLPTSKSASPSPFAKSNKNTESHLAKNPHRSHLHNVSPETATKLKNKNAKNPFTAPETSSGMTRRRTNTLLSQAMQDKRGPAAFPSATEISVPEKPVDDPKPQTPLGDQSGSYLPQPDRGINVGITSARENPSPATPSPIHRGLFSDSNTFPSLGRDQSTNTPSVKSKATQPNPNTKPLDNSQAPSTLFLLSSSAEGDSHIANYRALSPSRNRPEAKAQDELPRQRTAVTIRVPIVYRNDEVVVMTMPRIVAILMLCIVALVGLLLGAGLSYYLS